LLTRKVSVKGSVKVSGQSAGGSARLPIDDSLFFKLVRVVNLTARPFVETLAKSHQLSLNEWRVMVVLASRPGVAAHEVADATGLDKMSVSRAISALVRHRRIQRQADAADARRTLLQLNATGRKLYESIGSLAAEREAQLFAGVGRQEVAQLAALVDRLTNSLSSLSSSEPKERTTRRVAARQR
jgi:DNA-binding MarR family transcriptional regulator